MSARQLHWLALAAVVTAAGAAAADELAPSLAPDIVEGAAWAAECVATPGATAACNGPALASGKPGGILHDGGFTMLLIDGRILAATCATSDGGGRLRATGLAHDAGAAFTPVRLYQDCGVGWVAVDLPHAGVAGGGAVGGDE
jgi:hypothetical protein